MFEKKIFRFFGRFVRVRFQSLQKVLEWPKKYFDRVSKNAEFDADFESVEKVVKKCLQKSY